jgi:hypothetical protein
MSASLFLQGQSIDNIIVKPDFPTTDDSVFVLVQCTFPNTNCKPYIHDVSQDSTNIYASALHCVGSLTAICNYTDTFKFSFLSAGDYTFYFTLNAGAAPEPCTPGIVSDDNDSASFTVTTATTLSDIQDRSILFTMNPNPSNGDFKIYVGSEMNAKEEYQLHVISTLGNEVAVAPINLMNNDIHLNLQPGIYFCYIEKGVYRSVVQKLIITTNN